MENKNFSWQYASVGGVVKPRIDSGEAISRLGELDQKKWTVMSCPADGLNIDPKTLKILDTDGDGKIRVNEVVAAAEWLTSVIKDKDLILNADSVFPIDEFNEENATGAALSKSAKQILSNLGLEKNEISIADSSDSVAIFKGTKFNGDGIVTPASADDEATSALIQKCIDCCGSVLDRTGEAGVNAEIVDKFYAALADYSAWKASSTDETFPFGENTAAALAACDALKDKIADYFMRCKLISFNEAVSGAVDLSVEKVASISERNLTTCADEIASYPLARPSKSGKLPYDAINPAWQASFNTLKSLVLDVDLKGKNELCEEEWNAILAKFGPYTAWAGSKKGAEVEGLGLEAAEEILKGEGKAAILDLIEKDKALEAESASIDAVDKFMHLYRDFYRFLNNYVAMNDFYGRGDNLHAIFEAGKLYIDERCCNLCVKVSGSGNHAEAAQLGGMFLIYCTCTSKKLGKTQNILAVMTDGGVKNLRPGKNAIFYDLDGNDWDAVVTKIVDNPISIKQAFWSPYRKFANTISDKIMKSAADKESNSMKTMEGLANTTTDAAAAGTAPEIKSPAPFDIAKFAGIFAAVGMGLGMVGAAITKLIDPISNLFMLLIVLIVCISGPSMFIAWTKLRKRDLGPILNANGWAINSTILINILFGKTLTSVAKYPIIKGADPFQKKKSCWPWIIAILAILAGAFAALYFTGHLGFLGIGK